MLCLSGFFHFDGIGEKLCAEHHEQYSRPALENSKFRSNLCDSDFQTRVVMRLSSLIQHGLSSGSEFILKITRTWGPITTYKNISINLYS